MTNHATASTPVFTPVIDVSLSNNSNTLDNRYCGCIEFTAEVKNLGAAATVEITIAFVESTLEICTAPGFGTPYTEEFPPLTYVKIDRTASFAANETKIYYFQLRLSEETLPLSGNVPVSVEAGVVGVPGSGDAAGNIVLLGDFGIIEGTVEVSEAQQSIVDPDAPLVEVCCVNENECQMDNLVIDGTLIVDEDYCFRSFIAPGTIIMKENAKIIVLNGQKLTLINVEIYGCEAMWDAIEVKPGGELVVINCTIRDGKDAIFAWAGSTLNIANTDFINNLISLRAQSKNEFGAVNVTRLSNNTFLTEGGLLPPYAGQKGLTGISLSNLSAIDISAPNKTLKNHFKNLRNGILSYESNVVCNYNSFENIVTAGTPGSGYAIRTTGGSTGQRLFQQKGLGKDYAPTFINCFGAISCSGTRLTVTDNYMTNVIYGVRVNFSGRFNIYNNVIEASQAGIHLLENIPSYATIQNNDISMDEVGTLPDAIGIRINETPIGFEGVYKVLDNFIALSNARTGIQVTSGSFIKIVNNTIFMADDNVEYDGIRFLGSWKPLVSCNEIIGPDAVSFTETKGIFGANSTSSNVTCNIMDETELGIQFFGLNEGSLLRGNEFKDHYIGLQLGEYDALGAPIDASIGLQIHHGNRWTEDAASAGVQARHVLTFNSIIEQSKFFVDSNDDSDFLPTNNKPTNQWFVNQGGSSYTCPSSNDCPNGIGWIPFEPEDDELWKKLARGTFASSLYETEQRWSGAYNLYKSIQEEEYEPAANTAMDTFLIEATSSEWADFYAVEKDAQAVLIPAEKDLEDLAAYDSLLVTKFEALLSLSIQANTASTEAEADSLLGLKAAIVAAASAIGFSLDTLGIRILEDSEAGLAALKTDNDAITTTETPAEMLQIVNRLFFNSIASGIDTFTNTQKNTLLAIATMCPLEGGQAVYFARSLYALVAPDTTYEDSVLCTIAVPLRRQPSPAALPSISLYPNPAADWIALTTNLKETTQVDVVIYNVLGKKLKTATLALESGTASFDVNDLLPGIYFLQVEGENLTLPAAKFSVVR